MSHKTKDAVIKRDPSATGGKTLRTVLTPAEDEIRLRAYEKYRNRNGSSGTALNDWLEAERELRDAAQRGPAWKPAEREKALLSAPSTGADSDPAC